MCRTSLLSMWLKNHDPTVSVFSHEVDATCVAQNKQLTFRSENVDDRSPSHPNTNSRADNIIRTAVATRYWYHKTLSGVARTTDIEQRSSVYLPQP
jgi:hypothetical protein